MGRGRVLVVDDDTSTRVGLSQHLRQAGFTVVMAADAFKAMGKLEEFCPDVVVTDLYMPGMDGIHFLAKARTTNENMGVIVTTSFGTVDSAVKALREGAADFLTKPVNVTQLCASVSREIGRAKVRRDENGKTKTIGYRSGKLIAESAPMRRIMKVVPHAATTNAPILISGEPGTGRQTLATTIHFSGSRGNAPFREVFCFGKSEALVAQEIFGIVGPDGAANLGGALDACGGGDLVLLDVDALALNLQRRLLDFVTTGTYKPIGSTEARATKVRIIATAGPDLGWNTNEQLDEDFFTALSAIHFRLPPLRERGPDIPLLIRHVLDEISFRLGARVLVDDAVYDRLAAHHWPGNLGELHNVIEEAAARQVNGVITPADLPPGLGVPTSKDDSVEVPGTTLADLERWAIKKTLASVGGSTSKAARILGISARKIQYRLREYGELPNLENRVHQDEA